MIGEFDRIRDLLAGRRSVILVHVASVRGSAPREAGARMVVDSEEIRGTIGGGELEWRAIAHARNLLESGRADILTLSLGPELGQCCGGAVTLAFEIFVPADLAFVERVLTIRASEPAAMRKLEITASGGQRRELPDGLNTPAGAILAVDRDRVTMVLALSDSATPLWLFGAGHVGRAIVAAFSPLDFAITWVDARSEQFPIDCGPGIRKLELAMPELIVDEAPPGAFYLVMTHSHPLDEEICAAILDRGDFAYVGLIGSRTKRARFRKRLGARNIPMESIDNLQCPIGLPGLEGKAPAVLAASVAADLLLRRQHAGKPVTGRKVRHE